MPHSFFFIKKQLDRETCQHLQIKTLYKNNFRPSQKILFMEKGSVQFNFSVREVSL